VRSEKNLKGNTKTTFYHKIFLKRPLLFNGTHVCHVNEMLQHQHDRDPFI